MRTSITGGCIVLAMLAHAGAAWGAQYWVSPKGSDGASGAQNAPWATLQHAVDTAAFGDTITVADGTYAGFWMKNRQGDAQHRLIVVAQNPLGAKITSPSPTSSDPNDDVQLVSASFVTVDGFDVSGAPRAGISIRTLGDVTGADTTDDVVQNCHSHDNGGGQTAGRHDGVFTGFAANVVIQNNEVDHNSEHGIYVSNSADNPVIRANRSHENLANGLQINADVTTGGDGIITGWLMEDNVVWGNGGAAAINLDGACNGTLRNNLVYDNANGGITLFQGDAATASSGNEVVDNTVYDPNGARSAIQVANGANDNVLFDNVFWSGSTGLEVQTVSGLVHDYNVVCSYTGTSASAHEATPPASQLFVNPNQADYRGGPALVDQGTGMLGGDSAPSVDIAGNARPQGAAYDIGCYEQPVGPLLDGGAVEGGGGGGGDDASEDASGGDDGSTSSDAGSGGGSANDGGARRDAGNDGGGPHGGAGGSGSGSNVDAGAGSSGGNGEQWVGAGSSSGCTSAPGPAGSATLAFLGAVAGLGALRRRVRPRR